MCQITPQKTDTHQPVVPYVSDNTIKQRKQLNVTLLHVRHQNELYVTEHSKRNSSVFIYVTVLHQFTWLCYNVVENLIFIGQHQRTSVFSYFTPIAVENILHHSIYEILRFSKESYQEAVCGRFVESMKVVYIKWYRTAQGKY